MNARQLLQYRLYNQQLSKSRFKNAGELVSYMGAIQAQDYAGAKWALGLRLNNATDSKLEKQINAGEVLRTHVLRPTWHFVNPADIRWMIELTAPRLNQQSAGRNRQLKLDAKTFAKSNDILAKALQGGKQLTRTEIAAILEQGGIATDTQRLIHLLFTAELDCVITSGARQGKQFTYASFDERAPNAKSLPRDESIARLALTYFNSRGPATLHDFVWWSGLTVADAKTGLEEIKEKLTNISLDNQTYYLPQHLPDTKLPAPISCLLPPFDEYTIAYKDRSAAINTKHAEQGGYLIFDPAIMLGGSIAGNWKRSIGTKNITVNLNPFDVLKPAQQAAVDKSLKHYAKFMGMGVEVR
ncbi:winged helix DNA-binding domain-containing protein [Mucilaginibacter gynuensis]|uniref:Winged helix DNA-binding domain-containing protein n=1 Tax=Mucilaginibacter gynuensis TaxID=1302236 RepID=A0ABP8G355_9SPHI